MEKNTQWLLPLPKEGTSALSGAVMSKKDLVPSAQTVKNILGYSKALRVKKSKLETGFIDYIAN